MADGVTQCKFEATYPSSDECVLHRILDVLVVAVGCPAGVLLSNDNLISIFQVGAGLRGRWRSTAGRAGGELRLRCCRPQAAHKLASRCRGHARCRRAAASPQACYRIGHFQTEKGRDTSGTLSWGMGRAL